MANILALHTIFSSKIIILILMINSNFFAKALLIIGTNNGILIHNCHTINCTKYYYILKQSQQKYNVHTMFYVLMTT